MRGITLLPARAMLHGESFINLFGLAFRSSRCSDASHGQRLTMSKRSWFYLLALVLICAIAGGWYYYYKSKCHGIDECAAQAAEGRERDAPSEPR
jgi:hypothetical protein